MTEVPLGRRDPQRVVRVLGRAHRPAGGEGGEVDASGAPQVRAEQAVQVGRRPQDGPPLGRIVAPAGGAHRVLDVGDKTGQRLGGLGEAIAARLPTAPRGFDPLPEHGRSDSGGAAGRAVAEERPAHSGLGRVRGVPLRGRLLGQQRGGGDPNSCARAYRIGRLGTLIPRSICDR
ncbi:hypothetical protein GCM10010259_61220 [Streptomyces daghestanicus]|uniref:Uncharacterized protein n=1 Tax=Streptomyces daghestanicus TaxID=66885 RepID=A0ABQ3Q7L6_9ACTN|nr:hypothetical protein GCM10010259_61220 [Streptomyces daghestanicus]GHI33277.1 hypothetical protein Sdagh_50070 [Streptomyces daghestanicus]